MAKLKIIIAVVAVIGILFILTTTPSLNLSIPVLSDIGKVLNLQGLFTFLSPFPTGSAFDFELNSSSETLVGQGFEVKQASVALEGKPAASITIGSSVYKPRGDTNIRIVNFDGKISFTFSGVGVNGEADEVFLGETAILPAEKKLKVVAEILPNSYSVNMLEKHPLTLSEVYGILRKTGGAAASQQLINATLQIEGFRGTANSGKGYVLSGSATAIKSQTFSWNA